MVRRRKYARRKRRVTRPRRRAVRKRITKRRRLGTTGRQQTLQRVWGAAVAGSGYSVIKDAVDAVTSASGPRKRARTATRTRRKPGEEGTGGYAQWTQRYAQARFGRLTPKKIDSLSLERVIFTHRRIGPFNDYGQQWLPNYIAANGIWECPLYLFELNSCNNFINGTKTDHSPVKRLYQSGQEIGWLDVQGHTSDGNVLSAAWQTENSSHLNTASMTFPGDTAIHKWSSLDLELWGCRNKPTKYHIMLCQISEDVLPDYAQTGGQRAEFWQSMVKHYTYSPLAKMDDGYSKKKFKILKQYKVNLDPTASYENDPDPHVKTLKLFYRFNRKCNFKWVFSTPNPLTITDMNQPDWKAELNQNTNQVHPNARLYVMIRASNFTQITSPAVVDNTTNPSMSWNLRTCYLVNS